MASLSDLISQAASQIDAANDLAALDAVRVSYLGKKGEISEHPYLGLVMSGVPHVSNFTRNQVRIDEEAMDEHPMVAQKVRINGASVSILDVDAMVDMVDELAA